MDNYTPTYVREKEGEYFPKKKGRVMDEQLVTQQIEDFTLYLASPETALPEKKERKDPPKLLVDQYYQIPGQNRRAAGRFGFRSLNKWEGVIAEIYEDGFRAILTDLIHGGPQEEATISMDEVSDQDIPLLKPGAIFYWNIGYETINGQRRKASIIRFKRLPKWSQKDWDQALDKANEFHKGLQWE